MGRVSVASGWPKLFRRLYFCTGKWSSPKFNASSGGRGLAGRNLGDGGVAIYDNGVPRAKQIPWTEFIHHITYGSSPDRLYIVEVVSPRPEMPLGET